MLIPLLSVLALLCAILLSMWSRLNVGLLALTFAYGLGVIGAKMTLRQAAQAFRVPLFLTVLALTLLFGQAQANGTLGRIGYAVQLARGRMGLLAAGVLCAGGISLEPSGRAISGRWRCWPRWRWRSRTRPECRRF